MDTTTVGDAYSVPVRAMLDTSPAAKMAYRLDAHASGHVSLEEVVRSFVQSGELRRWLTELLSSPEQLQALAVRSYQHGNGFTKFELLAYRGYKVRLHGWMPGVQAEENIHDHRWGFTSMILAGELHSEAYIDDLQGAILCEEFAYVARQQGRAAHKEKLGEARLRKVSCQIRTRGEVYTMVPAELHRICVDGRGLTATLMISAPPLAGGSRLLVESSRAVDPDVAARPLDPAFALSTLHAIMAHFSEFS